MPEDAKKNVAAIKDGTKAGTFEGFTGPIVDNTGKERLPKDAKADQDWKDKVDFYVQGEEGKIPTATKGLACSRPPLAPVRRPRGRRGAGRCAASRARSRPLREPAAGAQARADPVPHHDRRLSLGKVVEGRLECAYHGWQFGAGGVCRKVPALPDFTPGPAHRRAGA